MHRLVLWQPVVSGAVFLQELEQVHRRYEQATGHLSEPGPHEIDGDGVEVLGFHLGQAMVEDLAGLDLIMALTGPPAEHALLITNAEAPNDNSPAHLELRKRLQTLAVRVEDQHCPDPEVWLAEPYKMFMPRQSINLILSWFASQQP